MSITRGCGSRVNGAVYLVVNTGRGGERLDYFTICQPTHEVVLTEGAKPVPIDVAFQLTPKGVKLVERDGVTHVLDWVGSENYPNVLDFWYEAWRHGVSRRVNLQPDDYARLSRDSRLILLHPRAYIANPHQLVPAIDAHALAQFFCPRHDYDPMSMCRNHPPKTRRTEDTIPTDCRHWSESNAGLWWYDVLGDCEPDESRGGTITGAIRRKIPCGVAYQAFERPARFKPQYRVAAFLSLPISGFEFVDPEGKFEKDRAKLAGAQLPVETVAE